MHTKKIYQNFQSVKIGIEDSSKKKELHNIQLNPSIWPIEPTRLLRLWPWTKATRDILQSHMSWC